MGGGRNKCGLAHITLADSDEMTVWWRSVLLCTPGIGRGLPRDGAGQVHRRQPEPAGLKRDAHRQRRGVWQHRRQPGGAVQRPAMLRVVLAEQEAGDLSALEVAAQGRSAERGAAGRRRARRGLRRPDLERRRTCSASRRRHSPQQHAAARWTVAFTGFAPGFGYLVSPDWPHDVPRLAARARGCRRERSAWPPGSPAPTRARPPADGG